MAFFIVSIESNKITSCPLIVQGLVVYGNFQMIRFYDQLIFLYCLIVSGFQYIKHDMLCMDIFCGMKIKVVLLSILCEN